MAVNRNDRPNGYQAYPLSRPIANVGGYRGVNYITVNTTLPKDPRFVDRSKLPNGCSPADYANMFSRLPRELDAALRTRGHAEVSIAVDENGQVQRVNAGSTNAPRTTYVSAMIKRMPDGTNTIVGIWGGTAGGGNNGAAAAMSTIKMMSTLSGRAALANSAVLEATQMQWGNTVLANTGSLNRNPLGWSYGNNGATTFIPYTQTNTFGVHKQDSLGEHHSRSPNTWGCTTGTEQSFLARTNSRLAMMMGHTAPTHHDWGNGLGIQNHPMNASSVFVRNKAIAASSLGPVFQLNPLMFDTGNQRYMNLAQQLNISPRAAPAVAMINQTMANIQAAIPAATAGIVSPHSAHTSTLRIQQLSTPVTPAHQALPAPSPRIPLQIHRAQA